MRYDLLGSTMLIISAFLYAARHITTALFTGSNITDWSAKLYGHAYQCVAQDLTVWAGIAFLFGVLFLGFGIFHDIKQKPQG